MIQEGNIFVSTGAFRTNDLHAILDTCLQEEIHGLELSSPDVALSEKLLSELEKHATTKRLSFLVHNYFPPPRKPFVLNLASNDEDTLEASREHCKRAVTLSEKLRAPFYSVHAGFCFHADPEDLGKEQTKLPRIPMEEAEEIFVGSLKLLSHYAARCGVDIAIENNVLAPFNLINSRNELFLGLCSDELLRIIDKVNADNLYCLLDVAHLKVSAKALGFDPVQFIREVAPFVKAVHLSDNDGFEDSNETVTRESWFWRPLLEYLPPSTVYVLEVFNSPLEAIVDQLDLMDEKIKQIGQGKR